MLLRFILALAVTIGVVDLVHAQRGVPTYRGPTVRLVTPGTNLVTPKLTLPKQNLKIYKTPRIQQMPKAAVPRVIHPPPPCGPECQRRLQQQKTAEEARRKYAQCVGKARRSDGRVSRRKLVDCAFGFMSPYRFSRFRNCINGKRPTVWKCFRSAYL